MEKTAVIKEIRVNEKELEKPLNKKVNNESKLYLVESNIYKILNQNLRLSRKPVVEKLLLSKPNGICNPNGILIDEDNDFLGCSFPFLKDYENLDVTKIPYELRIKYLKKINEAFRRLIDLNLYYHDTHFNNFMVKDDDIVLVDSDSAILINDSEPRKQKKYLYYCCKNLCNLSLSLILGFNISYFNRKYGQKTMKKYLLSFNDKALNEIVLFAYSNHHIFLNDFYADRLVDSINSDTINSIAMTI